MINVNFRVLGIYFGCYPNDPNSLTREVSVQVQDNPTVYDVMKAVAIKATTGGVPGVNLFGFMPILPSPGQDLSSIVVDYDAPPRADRPYPEGIYMLEDSASSNPNKVLQYYIIDSNGVQKNRNNNTAPFSDYPDEEIMEGDTVLWRQVSICVGPNGSYRAKNVAQRSISSMMQS